MKLLMESKNVGGDVVKEEECTNIGKKYIYIYTYMHNENIS
jgi:hypothetical protein